MFRPSVSLSSVVSGSRTVLIGSVNGLPLIVSASLVRSIALARSFRPAILGTALEDEPPLVPSMAAFVVDGTEGGSSSSAVTKIVGLKILGNAIDLTKDAL